ncbi:DNA topoisomerase-3 [Tistlia consotensis]|uniref:DNA topoisomerase n=1 Tax=Tistlia consotensis USBA 355 TaxID=560819 RepID=A0A1Y6C0C7_9PROT|nr:DNA topoisomerase [Tistlia consotensis]SMF27330.1 DNA topoisomerase-3 [Tistlia consotensis USBA 355]SNR66228.1 DNA topoisomerase-3 [Tistlia consotensis]
MKVWLTEKPDAGRALARVLGGGREQGGYIETPRGVVTWGIGHLLESVPPDDLRKEWKTWAASTLPLLPPAPLPLRVSSRRGGQFRVVDKLLGKATSVVIATDADREGEAIARELLERCRYRGPLARLKLVALEESAIKGALAEMEAAEARQQGSSARSTEAWYAESQARTYQDWVLGYGGTRACSIALRPGRGGAWRAGPVKTPTLALIERREREIESFRPRDYYVVEATFDRAGPGQPVTLRHAPEDKIFDRARAELIAEAARSAQGPVAVVDKQVKVEPPRLFNSGSLTAKAGQVLGWAPSKTRDVLQQLYDRGYVTYPRTDSTHLPSSYAALAPKILRQLSELEGFEALKALERPLLRRGSRYDDRKVSPHHAIAPSAKRPERQAMGADAWALYRIIAKNYAANHMEAGVNRFVQASLPVTYRIDGSPERATAVFATEGSVPVKAGWRALYRGDAEQEAERGKNQSGEAPGGEAQEQLPDLAEGERLAGRDAEISTKRTQPPERFKLAALPNVMARLVDLVEDPVLKKALATDDPDRPKGLGTPATRIAIADELLEAVQIALCDAAGRTVSPSKAGPARRRGRSAGEGEAQYGGKGQAPDQGRGLPPATNGGQAYVRPTAIGRALVRSLEAAWPTLVDPVSRAISEAGLVEIGAAGARAREQRDRFCERARDEATVMSRAILAAPRALVPEAELAAAAPRPARGRGAPAAGGSGARGSRSSTPGASRGGTGGGGSRPPSQKQIALLESLARERGLKLPDGWRADGRLASEAISQALGDRGGPGQTGGARAGGKPTGGGRPAAGSEPRHGRRRG